MVNKSNPIIIIQKAKYTIKRKKNKETKENTQTQTNSQSFSKKKPVQKKIKTESIKDQSNPLTIKYINKPQRKHCKEEHQNSKSSIKLPENSENDRGKCATPRIDGSK